MKIFILIISCLICASTFAQEEELNQLLSEEQNIITQSYYSKTEYSGSEIITHNVRIKKNNGFSFHIADHIDGMRVVTCLDGEMKGYQGYSYNGIQTNESTAVEWHKGYFVHFYQGGTITSYPNKQIVRLY